MLAHVLRGWLAGFADAGLVNGPRPKLIDLFLLQASNVGLERGGSVRFQNFWEVQVKFCLLLDDVVSDGSTSVEVWQFPSVS